MRNTIKAAIAEAMAEAAGTIAYRIEEAITEAGMADDGHTIDDRRYNNAIEAASETTTAAMIAAEAVEAAGAYGIISEEEAERWERGQ